MKKFVAIPYSEWMKEYNKPKPPIDIPISKNEKSIEESVYKDNPPHCFDAINIGATAALASNEEKEDLKNTKYDKRSDDEDKVNSKITTPPTNIVFNKDVSGGVNEAHDVTDTKIDEKNAAKLSDIEEEVKTKKSGTKKKTSISVKVPKKDKEVHKGKRKSPRIKDVSTNSVAPPKKHAKFWLRN